jgi:NAD(P)-dependent dehydrogenase (short-subunit alcohol dehydrogenase family)
MNAVTRQSDGMAEKLSDLSDKVVVVTGAAGQVGQALSKSFRDCGAMVIGLDLMPKTECQSGEGEIHSVDVTCRSSVRKVLQRIQDEHGTPDILVNNAGIAVFSPSYDRTEGEFDDVFSVNLKGVFNCIVEFAKLDPQAGSSDWRSIVNISSLYGIVSPDPRIYVDLARNSSEIYGASKAAVIQITRYFAVHLSDRRIRVNAVSPGGIFNPKSPQGNDFLKAYGDRCPMGRLAEVSEVAGGVIFLASSAATYINGHNLVIDGGFTSW